MAPYSDSKVTLQLVHKAFWLAEYEYNHLLTLWRLPIVTCLMAVKTMCMVHDIIHAPLKSEPSHHGLVLI